MERVEPQARRQQGEDARAASGTRAGARSARQSRTQPARQRPIAGSIESLGPNGASKLSGTTNSIASCRGTQVASQSDPGRHRREGERPELPHHRAVVELLHRHGMDRREARHPGQPRRAPSRPPTARPDAPIAPARPTVPTAARTKIDGCENQTIAAPRRRQGRPRRPSAAPIPSVRPSRGRPGPRRRRTSTAWPPTRNRPGRPRPRTGRPPPRPPGPAGTGGRRPAIRNSEAIPESSGTSRRANAESPRRRIAAHSATRNPAGRAGCSRAARTSRRASASRYSRPATPRPSSKRRSWAYWIRRSPIPTPMPEPADSGRPRPRSPGRKIPWPRSHPARRGSVESEGRSGSMLKVSPPSLGSQRSHASSRPRSAAHSNRPAGEPGGEGDRPSQNRGRELVFPGGRVRADMLRR